MKRRGMLALSLLFGMVCALSVMAYLSMVKGQVDDARAEAMSRYGGDQVEVCVATRDIAPGEKLDASNAEVRPWLVDLLPEGAVGSLASKEGMRLTSSIGKGEVVTEQRFSGSSDSLVVPAGYQAVGLEVESAQAVGGALSVGNNIDVYAVSASGVSCIARGVSVLACGSGSGSRSWVTLAVADEGVQEIIAATQSASLYLTLPGSSYEGSSHGA